MTAHHYTQSFTHFSTSLQLFQEDSKTGIVNIAFSSDSTCGTDLVSATEGYEVLTLQKQPESEWPVEVMTSICRCVPKKLTRAIINKLIKSSTHLSCWLPVVGFVTFGR